MAGVGKQSLESFLDDVAAATPAPGGGSSAGVTCALAAALVQMSAGLAGAGETAARAAALRMRGLELAEEELGSYAPVLEARRSGDEEGVRAALVAASRAPLAIADAAAAVAELGARVAGSASPAVRGDALTGVVLAEAAASTAARLVEINLGSGAPVEAARHAEQRASRARADATGRPPPAADRPAPQPR